MSVVPTSVVAAFEILLEEIEAEIDSINRQGASALEARDYETARDSLEKSTEITNRFRDTIDRLRREWVQVVGEPDDEEDHNRRDLGRLQRGLRTPEREFYLPILQAISEMGGSAPMGDVLDRVGELMDGKLRDVDFQPLASDPKNLRWRNTAQWARHTMVQEKLLKSHSPRGIWEIDTAGSELLKGQ